MVAPLGVISLVLALASPASADDKAQAALLTREAQDLLADGKVAEACTKLDASLALDAHSTTAYELGQCREKEGLTASAYRAYETSEALAKQEGRNERATRAKLKKQALFLKLPRVKVTVPSSIADQEGLVVTAGGATVPRDQWGKLFPVDPGDVVVRARTDAAAFETTVTMKAGQQRAVLIGDLTPVEVEAPPEPAEEPEPTPEAEPEQAPPPEPEPAPEPSGEGHDDGRLVVYLGPFVGPMLSLVTEANVVETAGAQYTYQAEDGGEFLVACGDTASVAGAGECNATFDPALSLLLGGQVFIGYGFTDSFQLGARGLLSTGFPGSFLFVGGPSFSANVAGPVWLGLSALVGTVEHEAAITGAKGSVPEAEQGVNGEEVDIPPSSLPRTGDVPIDGGLLFGGQLEIAITLLDNPSQDLFAGGLEVGLFPTVLGGPEGVYIAVPLGAGYRFY